MAASWYGLDGGGSYSIAGWQAEGSGWHDVEKGDTTFERSPYDIQDSEIFVFHYTDPTGNDVYYTIYGPFDDWETLDAIIADMMDRYGISGG